MKIRKNRILIICCLVIVSFIISIVPSFAHDGTTWYINFIDSVTSTTYTIEVPINDDSYNVVVYQDNVTHTISIYTYSYSQTIDQKELVYEFFYVDGVTYNFDMFNDHDSEVIGELGWGSNSSTIQGVVGRYYNVVQVYITCSTLYFGEYEYELGIQHVVEYPENYDLYTQDQYDSYDSSEYERGYHQAEDDITASQQLSYDRGYERGVADGIVKGQTESKELLGLVNIVLSNIYYTSTYFFNSIGIFGVTLGNIVVSLLIILLVFFIFKIVRG